MHDKIIKDAINVGQVGCPLYKLLHGRILKVWMKRFCKDEITPAEMASLGFGKYLIPKLTHSCNRTRRMFDVNIMVHGDRYNRMIVAYLGQL